VIFQMQHSEEDGSPFEITAMVDVVFILLAFFVLTTRIQLPERDFSMGYQETRLAVGAKAEDFPATISVQLNRTGSGVAIKVGQADLPANDFDAIRRKLTAIDMPDITVVIRADPSLTFDQVTRALDAVFASPMRKVSLSDLELKQEA